MQQMAVHMIKLIVERRINSASQVIIKRMEASLGDAPGAQEALIKALSDEAADEDMFVRLIERLARERP